MECIQSFERSLQSQSTLVLGIAMQEDNGSGDQTDLAKDPFVESEAARSARGAVPLHVRSSAALLQGIA